MPTFCRSCSGSVEFWHRLHSAVPNSVSFSCTIDSFPAIKVWKRLLKSPACSLSHGLLLPLLQLLCHASPFRRRGNLKLGALFHIYDKVVAIASFTKSSIWGLKCRTAFWTFGSLPCQFSRFKSYNYRYSTRSLFPSFSCLQACMSFEIRFAVP